MGSSHHRISLMSLGHLALTLFMAATLSACGTDKEESPSKEEVRTDSEASITPCDQLSSQGEETDVQLLIDGEKGKYRLSRITLRAEGELIQDRKKRASAIASSQVLSFEEASQASGTNSMECSQVGYGSKTLTIYGSAQMPLEISREDGTNPGLGWKLSFDAYDKKNEDRNQVLAHKVNDIPRKNIVEFLSKWSQDIRFYSLNESDFQIFVTFVPADPESQLSIQVLATYRLVATDSSGEGDLNL